MEQIQIIEQSPDPALALHGLAGAAEEVVGDAADSGEDNDLFRFRPAEDDSGHLAERFDAAQGGAADFEDDHYFPG